jgi:hypothetical protein
MAVRIARTVPRLVKARITTTEPDPNTGERTMPQDMTLLELVKAVSDHARSEAEVITTVVYLVNSGRVRLCGNFKDARFDLHALVAGQTAA